MPEMTDRERRIDKAVKDYQWSLTEVKADSLSFRSRLLEIVLEEFPQFGSSTNFKVIIPKERS